VQAEHAPATPPQVMQLASAAPAVEQQAVL
jgi:hypothetical protein